MTVNVLQEDEIITDFLKSLGPWRDHVIIGGGYALIIYKLYLSKDVGNPPIGTRDIDSLMPRKIPQVSKKSISEYLHGAGFKQHYKDYDDPATEAYLKEINGIEIEVEFLTDNAARINRKNKNIIIAGITAQPLRYLKLSLENTTGFYTKAGEFGKVVSPEAWIFHKGLTFTRRTTKLKVYKDLYGIWYASTQLGTFSENAVERLRLLAKHSTKWFKTFENNLSEWAQNASPIDWMNLEAQDPFGELKKPFFVRLISELST